MPIGENAGGIYVTIDGDNSPLVAKLEKTQAVAKQAGTAIAESFNSAAVSAQDLGFAAGSIVGAIERLTNVVREESAAASLAEQRNISLAASFAGLGRAANSATGALGGSINSARVLGSELRVVEGSGGILAAERFLTMIPGAVAAANFALPLIGLAAVVELVGRGIEKFTGLSEAEKKAQENIDRLTKSTKSLNEEIAKINTDTFRKLFGNTATIGAQDIPHLMGEIAAQEALIASTQKMIVEKQKLREERTKEADEAAKHGGSLGPGFVPAEDKELPKLLANQQTALAKMQDQMHASNVDMNQSQQADVKKGNEEAKRLADEKAEDEARVHEEFIVAQEDFDRRTAEENRKAEEEARKHAEAMKAARDLQIRDLADDGRLMDEQIRRNQESARAESEAQQRQATLAQRTGQIGIEKSGVGAESQNEIDKLKAQQQYALQIAHSKADELEHAKELSALDEKALQIKISTAQMELIQAVAEQNLIPTREGELKIAEDGLKIEQAKAALVKQEIQDQTTILQLEQQQTVIQNAQNAAKKAAQTNANNVGSSIGSAIGNLPKGIGDDIGGSIADALLGHHPGKSIGKELADTMVQSLKQTAAGLLKTLISGGVQLGLGALLGFASGGRPAPGVPYIVGENGPEIRIDDAPGTIIPSIPKSGGVGIGMGSLTSSMSVNSASSAFSIGAIHLHGVRDMQDVARRLPNVLKAASSSFQPASR